MFQRWQFWEVCDLQDWGVWPNFRDLADRGQQITSIFTKLIYKISLCHCLKGNIKKVKLTLYPMIKTEEPIMWFCFRFNNAFPNCPKVGHLVDLKNQSNFHTLFSHSTYPVSLFIFIQFMTCIENFPASLLFIPYKNYKWLLAFKIT